MAVTLRLGGVTFGRFEIPEQINFGGKQALTTHKLPGGERIIDAMGRDDDDVTWSGRFRGNQAVARARAVDRMRAAGRPVTLSWGSFRYRVLVESFKADFRRAYEIDYSVNCVVLKAADPTAGFDPLGLGALLNIDLSQLSALSDSLGLSGVTASITRAQSTLATAGAFATLPSDATASIAAAVGGTQSTILSTIGALNDAITPDAGVSAGGNPLDMADALVAQAGAMLQLNDLHLLGGTADRMMKNLGG